MAANPYHRMQTSMPMGGNTGATTSYGGGGYGHSSHQAHQHALQHSHTTVGNDPNFANNIQPEDYLEKQNVNGYLREAVSLLLENRPANPILFMAEHFRRLQQQQPQYAAQNTVTTANGQQVNVLNSNILKAYRQITLNKYDAKSFSDNVFAAYMMIEKDHTNVNPTSGANTGIKGNDLIKLTQMLCIDYPNEILNGILKLIDKKEEENVDFDEFLNAIKTIMLYDTYFEEMEPLFKYLDTKKTGKINKNHLVEAVGKLRTLQEKQQDSHSIGDSNNASSYQKCDLRIPHEDEIESVYNGMVVEEEGTLSYDEYLITLFKVTQDTE